MTKKTKIITPESGLDLDALDIRPGEYLGFYNTQEGAHHPFLIAFVGKGGLNKHVEEHKGSNYPELLLYHNLKDKLRKMYTLDTPQGVLQLFRPLKYGSIRIPDAQIITSGVSLSVPYFVEYAYAGIEEITKALKENVNLGFDAYANWLESEFGRIRTGR